MIGRLGGDAEHAVRRSPTSRPGHRWRRPAAAPAWARCGTVTSRRGSSPVIVEAGHVVGEGRRQLIGVADVRGARPGQQDVGARGSRPAPRAERSGCPPPRPPPRARPDRRAPWEPPASPPPCDDPRPPSDAVAARCWWVGLGDRRPHGQVRPGAGGDDAVAGAQPRAQRPRHLVGHQRALFLVIAVGGAGDDPHRRDPHRPRFRQSRGVGAPQRPGLEGVRGGRGRWRTTGRRSGVGSLLGAGQSGQTPASPRPRPQSALSSIQPPRPVSRGSVGRSFRLIRARCGNV